MNIFPDTLSQISHGRIRLSNCKKGIQVEYKNIVLLYDYPAFLHFFKNVEDCYWFIKKEYDESDDEFCFSTRWKSLYFKFSAEEIEELFDLLSLAIVEYELNE